MNKIVNADLNHLVNWLNASKNFIECKKTARGMDHIYTLNTRIVKCLCLVRNTAVAKNHKAVQCDDCDSWVHIACNYLNVYTYRKLQKDKSPLYCLCYSKKKMTF